MTDDDAAWLDQVRTGHPTGAFGHREHLLLAWLVLEQSASLEDAQRGVSQVVHRIATAKGVPQRYHRTVTDAWVRVVAHCRSAGACTSFDDMLQRHPWLQDKRILMRHYTSRTLASEQARQAWVEPDLLPIPAR